MMYKIPVAIACSLAIGLFSCTSPESNMTSSEQPEFNESQFSAPPVAEKKEHITKIHELELKDDYFWMRLSDEQKEAKEPDEQTASVVDYLNAENDYKSEVLKSTEAFQESLFEEIKGRIKQDDQSVPLLDNGFWYYTRYEEGQEYPIHCRKEGSMDAEEQVMLNVNEMAEGFSYYSVGGRSVSSDNNLLAFSVDTVSRREYTLQFKDLTTGEILADRIPETTGGATWANDNRTVFYSKKDPVTLRSYRIYKHVLGTDADQDVVVFEEKDETFSCGIGKTKSEAFLMIGSYSTVSSEWRYLDANNPEGDWQIIQSRERDLEYSCSHYGDHFYITTNRNAKNFKLVRTPINATGYDNWEDVLPHRDATLLEGVDYLPGLFGGLERTDGLNQIRIKRWDDAADYYIDFPDPTYSAYVGANPDFDTKRLRYGYNSMTTPSSVFETNMDTKETETLKQQEVLGGQFDSNNYQSERVMIEARDGTKVPVSIVYRKGMEKNGQNPFLLYAYGSYGYSMDAGFSSTRLSLLDRGFVYAIAHIRGGQDLGREWYEDGKMFNKMNTFTDFVDCGQAMCDLGFTSPDHLYAMGGSAGGLLMGAVINLAPSLFNGIIAAVPFVDVINTMLDESIPLTTGEFDEWGNPKNKDSFDYMMSYSPYDNVAAQDYPHMLVTTGYWDSQVQYWEPAKWVAKLRDTKTDDNLLIMDCNMETGHGGASGRFKRLRETAMEYAFFMMLEGIRE